MTRPYRTNTPGLLGFWKGPSRGVYLVIDKAHILCASHVDIQAVSLRILYDLVLKDREDIWWVMDAEEWL